MSGPSDRRGFLRGLVSLPLIGGGVTLIGNPVAAAEPVTERLMAEYVNWLAFERYRASIELNGNDLGNWYQHFGPAYHWHCERTPYGASAIEPSTRAAIVLSAVGCDWRAA